MCIRHGGRSHSLHATFVTEVGCRDSIGRPPTQWADVLSTQLPWPTSFCCPILADPPPPPSAGPEPPPPWLDLAPPPAGPDPPPPVDRQICGWTDRFVDGQTRVKTLPSLVLRTRAVIMINTKFIYHHVLWTWVKIYHSGHKNSQTVTVLGWSLFLDKRTKIVQRKMFLRWHLQVRMVATEGWSCREKVQRKNT